MSTNLIEIAGPIVFIAYSSIAFVINTIILTAALRLNKLRTLNSVMALQLVGLDQLFSLWTIIWFTSKLSGIIEPSEFNCQIEGSCLVSGFASWLVSSLFLSNYATRSQNIAASRYTHFSLAFLQYTVWIIPTLIFFSMAYFGLYNLMPSKGYCGFTFIAGSPFSSLQIISFVSVALFSFLLTIFFYMKTLLKKNPIIRDAIEPPDNEPVEPAFTADHQVSELTHSPFSTNPNDTTSLCSTVKSNHNIYHRHRSALYATICPITILICLTPSLIAAMMEFIADVKRSPQEDVVIVCILMLYKIIAPIVLVFTNFTIKNQVKILFSTVKTV